MPRRSAAALLASLCLVMASCGRFGRASDEDAQTGEAPATVAPAAEGPAGGESTTTAPPAAGTTGRAGGGPAATARSSPFPSTTTRPTATQPAARSDRRGPDPVAVSAAQGPPGSFARMLLRPQPLPKIVVEVLQQTGAGYRSSSLDYATAVLGDVSGKPVALGPPVNLATDDRSHSSAEIRSLADRNGKAAQADGQAVIRLLFLRGQFEGNDRALGVAVRGDVVAVFPDVIDTATTPVVDDGSIEVAVVTHEMGHVLGLVDLARDTGRDDPDHPGHSRNRRSVMYWAVESNLVVQVLGGGPPKEFDDEDRGDLAALRNGA